MAVLYNLDYDTVIKENIVHGSMDGKVDAVFIHDGDATLYQIKINKLEDMDVKDKMVSNFKEYLASGKIDKYFYSLVGDDNKKSKLIDLYKVDSIYDKICDIMNSDGDD